ncbi:MAG: hypothetical protein JW863_08325 [Chitinispirillaceae bacterium]|nr:hypothetical protein [Chitinispirillaceae bacterium]
MFTIRNNDGNRQRRMLLNCFRCIVIVMAFVVVPAPFAQCDVEENGYLFLHPYFEGTSWNATSYISKVQPDIEMCLDKPVNVASGKLMEQGTLVYTTADGTFWITAGPREDNDCPCCRISVLYDSPLEIAIPPELDLQWSLPFYLLGRGSEETGTAYLCVVGSGDRVFCLHVGTGSGTVEAVDTITVPEIGSSELTGVWGEATAGETDTAIWIGGSEGLLVQVPFDNDGWGTPVTLNGAADETVTAVGAGYAGMLSGVLYRRTGDSLAETGATANGALRYISTHVAVGDGGSVLVNRGGTWQDQSSGTDDYRLGNLTANDSGALVELVDAEWNYSTLQLSDSPTDIEKVSDEAMVGLNQGIYDYGIEDVSDGIITISVFLRDADGNRSVPSIQLRGTRNTATIDKADDGTVLIRQAPAAICSTEQAYLADTTVRLVLEPLQVKVETGARRGLLDASCRFWDWDYFKYESTHSWLLHDTLLLAAGGDTLRILNHADSQATVITRQQLYNTKITNNAIVTCEGRTVRLVPGGRSELRRVLLVDAAGRCVWRFARSVATTGAGTMLRSPQLHSGIHFLRIEYADGTTESRRLILFGR